MAFVIADRVRETTTTAGTGNLTLDGAVSKFRTFASVLSSSDTTYYSIVEQTGTAWEVGIGTFTSPATLARTTILSSSNGGSAVNFGAGTKDVFITLPASKTNVEDQPNLIEVNSSSDALRITQTGTGNALVVEDSANPDSSPFVVDASGNVGIGTTTPTAPLDVNGSVAITGTARRITGDFSNATQTNRIFFQTTTSGGGTSVGAIPNATGGNSAFNAFGSPDPANSSFAQLRAGADTSDVRLTSGITGTGTYYPLTFYTGGSERMRIDTSGNVGIGTSSPGYKLTVNGNISTENYNILSGSASYSLSLSAGTAFNTNGAAIALRGSTAGYNNHGMEFYAGGSERARIDSSGALLVGRTAALSGHTFQNAGGATTYRPTGTSSAGVHHFYSDVGGTASLKSYTQADGTYTNLSDQRFKTDITPARSYLGDLLKIQVVNYRWKNDDSAEKKLGVIAQQVEQVFPAMVKTVFGNTQTGETQKMIPYEVFVPMLITAIQELKAENDDLKARLTALEAK